MKPPMLFDLCMGNGALYTAGALRACPGCSSCGRHRPARRIHVPRWVRAVAFSAGFLWGMLPWMLIAFGLAACSVSGEAVEWFLGGALLGRLIKD